MKIKPLASMLVFLTGLFAMIYLLTPRIYAARQNTGRDRLKIGYAQAESYYEFDYQIYQIGMALIESHELRSERLLHLSQGAGAKEVWDALCAGTSDTYEFNESSFFDLSGSEYAGMPEDKMQARLGKQINDQGIDLMITMGTSAGLSVKEACEVPYMNFLASDPVSSGIVESADSSGNPRAWAHVNDGVEVKALSVMCDIFSPHRLGIVYNGDNPEAYIYSGAATVDAVAEANNMTVTRESVNDSIDDSEEAYLNYFNEMKEAHKRLAESGIDVYILTTSLLELEDFSEALAPLMDAGIPIFSINSTEDVRCGALAAVEMLDYENVGKFAVDILSQYRINGTSLDDMPQQYATSPFLVVNADTMRRTGIQLPLDTLISASEIYGKYERGEE